jgi:AraC-like DNA-binding protein/quercetin dioxygenase-like cupin family protein
MDTSIIHPDVLVQPTGGEKQRAVAYVSELRRGGGLPPHRHLRAQLLAVTSGSIAVTAEGSTFVAPPERAVWVPPNTVHETRHLASTRLRTLYITTDPGMALPTKTTVVQIGPLMRELITAIVARPRDYEERGCDGRLVAVLIDQIAASRALPLNLPMPKSENLLALAYRILDRPADVANLAQLARSLNMSSRTLERQFKVETGLSIRSFRRQAKLFKALELLSSNMPVSRISDALGFGEPSAFIAMFKAAFGATPGRSLSEGETRTKPPSRLCSTKPHLCLNAYRIFAGNWARPRVII